MWKIRLDVRTSGRPSHAVETDRNLLWTPARRKRASMLFLPMFFFNFFNGRLILRPWLTEVRESFTRGGPCMSLDKLLLGFFPGHP